MKQYAGEICREIDTVGALNDRITTSDMKEVVLVQEAHQGGRSEKLQRRSLPGRM